MLRHRKVAAAPLRSAPDTWQTMMTLVADSVEASASIDRAAVESDLAKLGGIGPILVAGRHLEQHPLVIRAAALDCEITTVAGVDALELEENLNRVPGAAEATTWHLYVPAVDPHVEAIHDAVAGSEHVVVGPPPEATQATTAAAGRIVIDVDALESLGR